MAANLLLEGPDLEALLVRAHREGGTKARIVRAEKVRRGGVFGFFAKEGFEVAVEIGADGEPTTSPAGTAAGASRPPASASASGPASASASGPVVTTEMTPIPTGLMSLAEKADAQERAAGGETISRAPEYQFADRTLGAIPAVQRPVFPDNGTWPTGATALATIAPSLSEDLMRGLAEPEMAAPPIRLAEEESVLPPGARPQFTSLIDQLRDGVRDGRHREEGIRHTTDHPVVAALHAGLTDQPDAEGLAGTSAEHIVSALEAEAWARVTTPTSGLDVQGSTTQIGTDGSTMSDPAAARSGDDHPRIPGEPVARPDLTPDPAELHPDHPADRPAAPADPDEAAATSALPNVRAATIVPNKPGRRGRTKNVPAQRPEPDADLLDEPAPSAVSFDESSAWSTTDLPGGLPAAASGVTEDAQSFGSSYGSSSYGSESFGSESFGSESYGSSSFGNPAFGSPSAGSSFGSFDATGGTGAGPDDPETPDPARAVPGAHRDPNAGHDDLDLDSQPRKASWWRLGRKRREDVTEEALLWTPTAEALEPIGHGSAGSEPAVESVPEQRSESEPLAPLTPPPGFEPLVHSAEQHTGPHTGQHREKPVSSPAAEAGDDDLLAELGVERSPAATGSTARTGGFTAAALQGVPAMPAASVIEDGDELAEDRQGLRDLGIPAAWTRRLRPGDRFTSVLGILDRMPVLDISEDAAVIAVVGPEDVVQLEAHRTALDLPSNGRPRAVVVVPVGQGSEHRAALAAATQTRPVVVAVPIPEGTAPADVRATLASVRADAVIAVVDAGLSSQEMTDYFDSLERIDAVAVDGALEAEQPAAVLGLELPVVRLDGISMDRIGWAALLCAQLAARDLPAVAEAS